MVNGFSIIMPTYNQAFFIKRAILSLKKQTYQKWELIIINDGSTDITEEIIQDELTDTRIKYLSYSQNKGMGYAINRGLDTAQYPHIAYLPSDDYYYKHHLESLKNIFDKDESIVLVYSGMNFNDTDSFMKREQTETPTTKKDFCLQLVQTSHCNTAERWTERSELVTEDLFIMFWHKLINKGKFIPTFNISTKWTSHPDQRHKICCETYMGNLYKYKNYYNVDIPIRIRMTRSKIIDEKELYHPIKKKIVTAPQLKILIIGALSYNPERICALEEHGCKLYGYWKPNPIYAYESVGPFPFGNIERIINDDNWIEHIKNIKPDIIYTVFSCTSTEFVYRSILALRKAGVGTPFVWHLKEGPQICIRHGVWKQLMELYRISSGNLYTNQLTKEWFDQFLPLEKEYMILDQDMPKINYFTNNYSEKLSASDGEIHTVIPGRMIGLKIEEIYYLTQNKIHIHLYTESYHKEKENSNKSYQQISPHYFHIHTHCPNTKWTEEFSKYDAGWLHSFDSKNDGDLLRLSWDDLNKPSRIGVFMAAGIPMIQKNNPNHRVASQELLNEYQIGILYNSMKDLSNKLKKKELINMLTNNVINNREDFAFDSHMPTLIAFFKQIIKKTRL